MPLEEFRPPLSIDPLVVEIEDDLARAIFDHWNKLDPKSPMHVWLKALDIEEYIRYLIAKGLASFGNTP